MSRTPHHQNLAARMGRWSAGHWKTATFGWLGLIVIAFAVGGQIGTKTIDPNTAGPGQSGQMDRILASGFKHPAAESVLVQSSTARAGSPNFDAAVNDVLRRIAHVAAVQNVRSPLVARHAGQISKDGHSALVQFEIRGTSPRPATGLARYSRPSMTRRTPIRASSSASSAMPARSRRWTPLSQTTLRGRGSSRYRSH